WDLDDVWEKGEVCVMEGVSKLPQCAYGKRTIFIDKESWLIPFSDIYDRSGELWKIWINNWGFRRKALETAGAIEYPDEMAFSSAIVMVDMQLEHATRAALPSLRFPGEQGWYFNQGEKSGVTEDWFTVAALGGAGHCAGVGPSRHARRRSRLREHAGRNRRGRRLRGGRRLRAGAPCAAGVGRDAARGALRGHPPLPRAGGGAYRAA